MKFRNTILAGLMLLLAFPLSAQQTSETKLDYEQIVDITENFVIVGQSGVLANTILELLSTNIRVLAQNGITSTNVQTALEELQTEINAVAAGASDGVATAGVYDAANDEFDITVASPGSDFSIDASALVEDADLLDNDASNELQTVSTADGADPTTTLSDGGGAFQVVGGTNVNAASSSNVITIAVPSLDDADADITNEAQTLSKVGSTVSLTQANGAGGGSFTDEVNDADANATNEIQAISRTDNDATLSLAGGTIPVTDEFTKETIIPGSVASTITLTATPDATYAASWEVTRNGQIQTSATSGTAADITISGTTATLNYRQTKTTDIFVFKFIAQ